MIDYIQMFTNLMLGVMVAVWIKNNLWRFHRCSVCSKYLITSGGNYATYTQSDGKWDVAHAKCAMKGEKFDGT
jgi:hypothetical protein